MTFAETKNMKAAAWTIGVHLALLLLFFFWRYTLPVAVTPPEMGMEVNLGTSDNGSGTDQPMSTEAPAPNRSSAAYKVAASSSTPARNILQTTEPDAPELNAVTQAHAQKLNTIQPEKEKAARVHTDRITPNINNRREEKPRYVYNGSTGNGGNGAVQNAPGANEGNTSGPGDRGVPNGTPGAANYTGSPGNGNGGINHTLTGRTISPNHFVATFHEGGRVVIKVAVDRNGNIVEKRVISSPSQELGKLALQKLAEARFSAATDPNAAPEQFGTITIDFRTHK